ncbi:MAG: hypothetical protein GY696_11910 [Gammaproteobacteria bacterium]|nr:hypothetical protein [Gammaproteobacteria bacterium]
MKGVAPQQQDGNFLLPSSGSTDDKKRWVLSQARFSSTSVEHPKSRSSTRIRTVEWQKEHRRRRRRKSTFDDKGPRRSHRRRQRGHLKSRSSSWRRSKCPIESEEEAPHRKKPQQCLRAKDKPNKSRLLKWEARKRRKDRSQDKSASLLFRWECREFSRKEGNM